MTKQKFIGCGNRRHAIERGMMKRFPQTMTGGAGALRLRPLFLFVIMAWTEPVRFKTK